MCVLPSSVLLLRALRCPRRRPAASRRPPRRSSPRRCSSTASRSSSGSPITGSLELARLDETSKPVFVFWKEPPSAVRDPEVRGEFWDLGRLQRDDSRFSNVQLRPRARGGDRRAVAGRDQVFVILWAPLVEAPLPPAPTIRAIALAPERYDEREVTRRRDASAGATCTADLPPGAQQEQVGLRAAVGGRRDLGHGAAAARRRVRSRSRGARRHRPVARGHRRRPARRALSSGSRRPSIRRASAPTDVPIEVVVPMRPAEPPPAVIFSAPMADDTDVDRAAPIRIQFSRDMDGKTFANRVRVSYAAARTAAAPPAPPAFTATYHDEHALARDQVRGAARALSDGDGRAPRRDHRNSTASRSPVWTLTFTTGG